MSKIALVQHAILHLILRFAAKKNSKHYKHCKDFLKLKPS